MTANGADEELIAAALRGSPAAWDRLVRRHESRVYNFGLRLTGNPADARDLMQEVFLGMYRNLHHFRGDAQFSSWLFRIAHNKAVDMRRRQRPSLLQSLLSDAHGESGQGEADTPGVEGWEDESSPQPEQEAIVAQDNQQIAGLLARLTLQQRLLVEMKVYQDMTFEEIAELEQIPANTAKTRFYTALAKLRALMEKSHEM